MQNVDRSPASEHHRQQAVEAFAPLPQGLHLQGAFLPGGVFCWAQVVEGGRWVDWAVTGRDAGEVLDKGSDYIGRARQPADREAALDARMRLLMLRYKHEGSQEHASDTQAPTASRTAPGAHPGGGNRTTHGP